MGVTVARASIMGLKLTEIASLIQLGKQPMPAMHTMSVTVDRRSNHVASVRLR